MVQQGFPPHQHAQVVPLARVAAADLRRMAPSSALPQADAGTWLGCGLAETRLCRMLNRTAQSFQPFEVTLHHCH